MSKQDFVDKVANEAGLSKKDAGAAVDAVLKTIESELKGGGEVTFTGFGKFHVAERGAREGRNPRTGESMQIAATKVPRFTAGSGLKKAIK
ncbi:MAG: DNA-binding protein HU-beta [Solirubrobacteraceae bacterium]|jgi:DNA-binding protein HU-beta|nr:DNA-binding protein HU-beta [Solirubrobacteraceae bacterium]